MASFNVSVHNSSPLISYTAAWLDTPTGDAYATNYTGAGFHTTDFAGATATFRFNGTGIWLYGAQRPGYGSYSLTVDGKDVFSGSARSDNPIFDQFLGGSSDLNMGEHTAVFTSNGGGAVDLDSLVFETQIGGDGQQVSTQTVDDTDSMMIYLPSTSQWSQASNSLFSNNTAHYTNTSGADVAWTFSGDAVAVYGGVSFDHGDYTVTLNGQKQTLNGANGQARIYHPQSLLFFASGLGSGTHSIDFSAGNGFFDLDSVVIYRATGNDSHSSGGMEMSKPSNLHVNAADGNNASSSGAVTQNQPISKAVIAGIVAASLLGLVSLIAIGMFLVSQCRKRRALAKEQPQGRDDQSPVLPIQHPDLEAQLGVSEKKSVGSIKRITNRFTMKSVASRWSQASFAAGELPPGDRSEIPPVPAMPMPIALSLPANPKLSMPVPQHSRASSTGSSRSSTLHSPDDDSVLDDYYYRQSVGSQNSDAPLRPARPPGLNLDLGHSFDHVPL